MDLVQRNGLQIIKEFLIESMYKPDLKGSSFMFSFDSWIQGQWIFYIALQIRV